MGLYDQLANLPQTPTVTPPEPPQTVDQGTDMALPGSDPKPAVKKPTAPRKPAIKDDSTQKFVVDPRSLRQRIITRASFEVYQDQVHILRQVSLTAKLAGEKLSISEMVREALDSYLTDKNLT
jgi:hypothetical protein